MAGWLIGLQFGRCRILRHENSGQGLPVETEEGVQSALSRRSTSFGEHYMV